MFTRRRRLLREIRGNGSQFSVNTLRNRVAPSVRRTIIKTDLVPTTPHERIEEDDGFPTKVGVYRSSAVKRQVRFSDGLYAVVSAVFRHVRP